MPLGQGFLLCIAGVRAVQSISTISFAYATKSRAIQQGVCFDKSDECTLHLGVKTIIYQLILRAHLLVSNWVMP